MNLTNFLFILLFSCSAWALTEEEEKKYDELEGVSFLRALIQDKKYLEVIRQFPSISKEKKELSQYHYHLAEAHFALKNYQKALEVLESGNSSKNVSSDYHKLWGRVASQLKEYKTCSTKFSQIKLKDFDGADWEIMANCLNQNGETKKLLEFALNHKTKNFDYFLMSQKYLTRNGLHTFAKEKRRRLLASCLKPDSYLRVWSILDAEKIIDLNVLETAHACHPESIELTSLLVKNLFTAGQYHSIAYIFETLSIRDVAYLKHAAEFYKVAGRSTVADYFFTLGDENGFLLARSTQFLNQENYAGLLTIPFKTSFLKTNKDLVYAMAYSQFKYLELESSKAILLSQKNKSSRDLQLENLIDQCKALDWKCRP